MDIKFRGNYKSLNDFDWLEIPKLSIITGPNGTGKTQVLELIHRSITGAPLPHGEVAIEGTFELTGERYQPEEVVFLKGDWGVKNIQRVDLSIIQSAHRSIYSSAFSAFGRQNNTSYKETAAKKREYDEIMHSSGKASRNDVSYEEFIKHYPLEKARNNLSVNQQINDIFFSYRVSEMELLSKNFSREEVDSQIGRQPWSVLREIIHIANLPFEINDPSSMSFWDGFELTLTHTVTKKEIAFSHLSSGEKIIMSLMFYMYQSQSNKLLPRLFLLDEPDAHLHPSLTQKFLNVIQSVLVEIYDVTVIMTTHSPSTVVQSREDSLFVMSITEPRIKKVENRSLTISQLTSGLVYVGPGTKYFFVEAKDDEIFYTESYSIFKDECPDNFKLPAVFIQVATKEIPGGKSVVKAWTSKFETSDVNGMINGIIDRDKNNFPAKGVFVLKRYSIENFLADPLVLYCALLDMQIAPAFHGINLKMGEEMALKKSEPASIQKIIDSMVELIEAGSSDLNQYSAKKISINFGPFEYKYPTWLIEHPGKNLISIYNSIFSSRIQFDVLFKAFKRLRMLPSDLQDTFLEIQEIK